MVYSSLDERRDKERGLESVLDYSIRQSDGFQEMKAVNAERRGRRERRVRQKELEGRRGERKGKKKRCKPRESS